MHLSMSSPRGGAGPRAAHGNLIVYPHGGVLIGHGHHVFISISNSRREVNHLLLISWTVVYCPGIVAVSFVKVAPLIYVPG